jgi:hypothetical protein
MTWYRPTLILSRLLIIKSGRAVYDEKYHFGLNVIRGRNSSGKTTIARAIVYALGADIKQWTPELLTCDFVVAEVIINKEFITLRRPIDSERRNPMEIFWGSYENALQASIAGWERYPYNNYENKKSFSKVLFESLGLPEIKGYQEANITMHQILRLMYGDQSSPANKILGAEDFDSIITREAIGDLLCGIYNDDLFNAKTRLKIIDSQLNTAISKLKSFYQIMGKNTSDIKSLDIDSEIAQAKDEIDFLSNENENVKQIGYGEVIDENSQELMSNLHKSKTDLYNKTERLSALDFDISDSEVFIRELKKKVSNLNDSIAITRVVNAFSYKNCPACFTDLSRLNRKDDECGLCGTKINSDTSAVSLHKMRNEIEMQIKESSKLLEGNIKEAKILRSSIYELKIQVKLLEGRYRDIATDLASSKQRKLQKNYQKIGYLERSIEGLIRDRGIIDQIKIITDERDNLTHDASELKEFIKQSESKQLKRRRDVALAISEEVANILKNDLNRQKQFSSAQTVGFDFGANSISVDGETTFSESSTVFLKNAFLLGLLAVSAKDERLRFPRFLLLDGIENGGMERERSHNLQELILALSDKLEVDHQIIITTAEIAPEIEGSAAPVGRFYTPNDRSLEFA